MTKRQKELEAWWEKIESIDDAGLMIGFRVGLSRRKEEPAQPAKVKVGGRRDTKSAATVKLGSAGRFHGERATSRKLPPESLLKAILAVVRATRDKGITVKELAKKLGHKGGTSFNKKWMSELKRGKFVKQAGTRFLAVKYRGGVRSAGRSNAVVTTRPA